MKDPYDGCDNANAGHEEAGDLVEVGAVILSRRESREGYNSGTKRLNRYCHQAKKHTTNLLHTLESPCDIDAEADE